MRYISFRWLITLSLILGIIFISIGLIRDIQPCKQTVYLKSKDNYYPTNDFIDADKVYKDISKNIPYFIPSDNESNINDTPNPTPTNKDILPNLRRLS